MIENKKMGAEISSIDKQLLFASVVGRFKPTGLIAHKFACLITIEKLTDASCRLTIAVDNTFNQSLSSISPAYGIVLISDFLEQFSQNLNS